MKLKNAFVKISFVILITSLLILGIKKISTQKEMELYNGLPLNYIQPFYIDNLSIIETNVSTADYIFVVKIINNKKTIYKYNDPYTIFEVKIIENIKGDQDENETIELEQYGGISKSKKSYTLCEGTRLLEEDKYYLLLGIRPTKDSRILINLKERIIKLNIDEEENIMENHEVTRYKNVYEQNR